MAERTFRKTVALPPLDDWRLLEGMERFLREQFKGHDLKVSLNDEDGTAPGESVAEARSIFRGDGMPQLAHIRVDLPWPEGEATVAWWPGTGPTVHSEFNMSGPDESRVAGVAALLESRLASGGLLTNVNTGEQADPTNVGTDVITSQQGGRWQVFRDNPLAVEVVGGLLVLAIAAGVGLLINRLF